MANRIFISYAHGDYYDSFNNIIKGCAVDRILSALRANDIEYWIDEKINPGDKFAKNIGDAIAECSIFVFISSILSNESPWACGEIHTAIEMNKRIVPIKIDHAPYNNSYVVYLSPLDFIDYCSNPQKAIEELINIANHSQESIILPHVVKQNIPKSDLELGGKKLSRKIFSLFSTLTVDGALDELKSIFEHFKNIGVKYSDGVISLQERLGNINQYVKSDIKRHKLIEVSSFIESIMPKQKRVNRLLTQLSLMVVYFWLDEASKVVEIQSNIANSDFQKTWWEENGADIVSVAAGIGGFIGCLMLRGNGRSVSTTIMRYSPSVSKENEENLKRQLNLFNGIKDTVGSLIFYEVV